MAETSSLPMMSVGYWLLGTSYIPRLCEECWPIKRFKTSRYINSKKRFTHKDNSAFDQILSSIFVLDTEGSLQDNYQELPLSVPISERLITFCQNQDQLKANCKIEDSIPRPTSLAVHLVGSTPPTSRYIMLRNNSDIFPTNMSSMFGSKNGTLRSAASTVTTPLSTMEIQTNNDGIINAFDYNKKLNGTIKTDKLKAFSNGGSIVKHSRIHKLPQPHRCQLLFKAIDDGLKECMLVTERDIDSLRAQLDSSTCSRASQEQNVLETQKQLTAAERYLKRLAFHESRVDELRDIYNSQLATIPDGENQPLASVVQQRQRKSLSATSTFKGAFKELVHMLCKLEAEMEMLAGTLSVEIKGIAGFARLAPGDVFEVQLKCGVQKWKSKVKIGPDKQQTWEAEAVIFKCLMGECLEIKVYEHKGFGKSVLMIEKAFDTLYLFRAQSQLITLDLNRNGSVKLSLQSTWNPLDGLLTPLTTANDLMHSSLALNGGSSKSNSTSSSLRTRSKLTQAFEETTLPNNNSLTDMLNFGNGNGKVNNGISRNGSIISSLITTPPSQIREQKPSAVVSPLRNGSTSSSPCIVRICEKRGIPLPNVAQVLRRLKPVVHSSIARFPQLIALEDILYTLDALIANSPSALRQSPGRNGHKNGDAVPMANGYGTLDRLRLKNEDIDDLDNNIINRPFTNGSRVQFSTDRPSNGNYNNGNHSHNGADRGVLRDSQIAPPSPSSSASSTSLFSNDTPNRRRRYLKKGESSPLVTNGDSVTFQLHGTLPRQGSSATMERSKSTVCEFSPARINGTAFGTPDLDICFYHHLIHCEMLLQKLVGYGPLHYCEQEALCKLTVETSILSYLIPLVKQAGQALLPKITQLLNDLDANTELQDVWLSLAGTGTGGYYLPSAALRHELRRSYGHIVGAKYEDLVDKVFDRVIHLLTDRSTWEPEIVTVFQFVYCFHEKQLVIFIESLAHETWIVETINCRVRAKIQGVMERLKHVPVPPPPDVLRHIGLVLIDEDVSLRILAESYLLHAQGTLRSELITSYTAFLEHDDSRTRRGACRALAVLTARRCLGALAYISHNDRSASVREEARRAVLAFGVEGNAALKNGNQNVHVIETTSLRF